MQHPTAVEHARARARSRRSRVLPRCAGFDCMRVERVRGAIDRSSEPPRPVRLVNRNLIVRVFRL